MSWLQYIRQSVTGFTTINRVLTYDKVEGDQTTSREDIEVGTDKNNPG